MIGCRPSLAAPISLGVRFRHERSKRAFRFAFGGRPIEPIAFASAARELARVLEAFSVMIDLTILALCIGIDAQDFDCGKLVPADTPVENFLFSSLSIEAPLSVFGYERQRKGKILMANIENGRPLTDLADFVRLVVGCNEAFAHIGIGDGIPGTGNLLSIWSQNVENIFQRSGSHGRNQRIHCR